jgi:hypothetical protein
VSDEHFTKEQYLKFQIIWRITHVINNKKNDGKRKKELRELIILLSQNKIK